MELNSCRIILNDGQVISMLVRDSMEMIHLEVLCEKLGHAVKCATMENE